MFAIFVLKRPGSGIFPMRLMDCIGKKAAHDIEEDVFLLVVLLTSIELPPYTRYCPTIH